MIIISDLLIFGLAPSTRAAATHESPSDSFEIGVTGEWYQYREPDFAKLQGLGFGLDGTYTYNWDKWFLRANVMADFINQSYSSNGTGSQNGIEGFKQEYRGLFGRNFAVSHATTVSPYIGVGYRNLFDKNGADVTSTGSVGYDRRSEYIYIPLGVTGKTRLGSWNFRPTAEFDYLVQGYQTSYLSDIGFDNNLNNTQKVGYGLRASLMVGPPIDFHNFSFGPYVRYWNIHDSNQQTLTVGGVPVATGLEPANNTLETGVEASIKF